MTVLMMMMMMMMKEKQATKSRASTALLLGSDGSEYKIMVLRDVTLCSLVESYQHLRGKCCILLQGRRVNRVGKGKSISKEMTKENRVCKRPNRRQQHLSI
jgi:hypothetical protein